MARTLVLPPVPAEGAAGQGEFAAPVGQRLVELTRDVLGCRRVGIVTFDLQAGVQRPVAVAGLSPDAGAGLVGYRGGCPDRRSGGGDRPGAGGTLLRGRGAAAGHEPAALPRSAQSLRGGRGAGGPDAPARGGDRHPLPGLWWRGPCVHAGGAGPRRGGRAACGVHPRARAPAAGARGCAGGRAGAPRDDPAHGRVPRRRQPRAQVAADGYAGQHPAGAAPAATAAGPRRDGRGRRGGGGELRSPKCWSAPISRPAGRRG